MLPIHCILCPTDFSEPSFAGVSAGNELAMHFGASLVLIHSIPPIPVIPAPHEAAILFNVPSYQQEMEIYAKNSLNDMIGRHISDKLKVETRVAIGEPADEIVKAAGEVQADLIVMATHGETGWKRFVSGSVTEKVVRLARCPVLTVHAPESAA